MSIRAITEISSQPGAAVQAGHQKAARIVGIDLCRSAAIIAAMGSHAMVAAGAYSDTPTAEMSILRFLLQMSPPIFIGLFGAMLEIAYKPKFVSGDIQGAVLQLLSRALQCYLLYAMCIIFRAALGDFSLGYALRCLILFGVTPFVDILKFYAVILCLAPLFIMFTIRIKGGLYILLGVSLAIHLFHPVLEKHPPLPDVFGGDYLTFPAGFLYGGGAGPGGPSIVHGLSFVFLGMLLGRIAPRLVIGNLAAGTRARIALVGIVIATGLLSALFWDWSDPFQTVEQIADMSLRNDNHPIYFALGILVMTALTWASLEVFDRLGVRFGRGIAFIGTTSLFTFSFGNLILIGAPRLDLSPGGSLIYSGVLLGMVLLLSWSFSKVLRLGRTDTQAGRRTIWARAYGVQSAMVAAVRGLATLPARAYAARLTP